MEDGTVGFCVLMPFGANLQTYFSQCSKFCYCLLSSGIQFLLIFFGEKFIEFKSFFYEYFPLECNKDFTSTTKQEEEELFDILYELCITISKLL